MNKLYYFIVLFASSLIYSCNSENKDTSKENVAAIIDKAMPTIKCYAYMFDSDTVSLSIKNEGTIVTGNLVYNYQQKDKNVGTINGIMEGNMLIAYYTFMSEGVKSVRQVAFKLEGNNFVEGYGNSYLQNDSMKFTKIDSLQFNKNTDLVEVPCR